MSKRYFLLFLLASAFAVRVLAQDSLAVFMPYTGLSAQLPGGDMAERFGVNGELTLGSRYKFKNNWLLGISYNHIFGSNIKNEDALFANLKTEDGHIIDNTGSYGFLSVYESGFFVGTEVGKIFPLRKNKVNSGIFFSLGPGYLLHRIKITVEGNNIPALNGDYRKGYDRLTGGYAVQEKLGYFHLDANSNIANYAISIEILEARTHPKRKINFDTMKPDAVQDRLDLLFGIKLEWMLPVRRGKPREYYIN